MLGDKWVDNIRQWIAGTKIPAFRQIETVSKKSKIPLGYFFLLKPPKEQFIRNKLEESGVLVMMNGVVGKNPHRRLDVNEFRAFAMTDDWAPLIFVNASDSQGARLFSLLHEAIHIWMGEDDLFNDRKHSTEGLRKIEIICNAAAGELLVPQKNFLKKWEESNHIRDAFCRVAELSKYFHCSESVISRKALDSKKIDKDMYHQIVQKTIDIYQEQKERKKSAGGDYYNTMGSRLAGCFVRAIYESVKMGRISYVEACRLTNTSRKTFSEIVKRLGVRRDD